MKPRETMTFDLNQTEYEVLEVLSRSTGIPVEVLLFQALVHYGEKMCPDLAWPRETKE